MTAEERVQALHERNDIAACDREDVANAIRAAESAAREARDAEVLRTLDNWHREHRYEGPFHPTDVYDELCALLRPKDTNAAQGDGEVGIREGGT